MAKQAKAVTGVKSPKNLPVRTGAAGKVKGGQRTTVKDAHDKYA